MVSKPSRQTYSGNVCIHSLFIFNFFSWNTYILKPFPSKWSFRCVLPISTCNICTSCFQFLKKYFIFYEIFYFSWNILFFIRVTEKEGETEKDLLSTNPFYRWPHWPAVGQAEARNLIWVSLVSGKGPNTQTILCCLIQVGRELDQSGAVRTWQCPRGMPVLQVTLPIMSWHQLL